ncbi:hypothetical protein STCU_05772 [Strigomonas culicis]|uniref:Pentacotripeptide-repeat region of PRORP domain-containing protein n=1 Tax=Strigomonas culicis TaxID=28005 RepID=S9VJY0_9TRYP|nr:hypothetical protein STCU_05772 [Strigomonas culicis]|eukprot:EPY27396.1 hypothetical protein STCU_05772 [Strigomonas culicis]
MPVSSRRLCALVLWNLYILFSLSVSLILLYCPFSYCWLLFAACIVSLQVIMNKKNVISELRRESAVYDERIALQDNIRRAKLRRFLAEHRHASQWATCVAALEDARSSGLAPANDMIGDAIQRCGKRGQIGVAKRLYTSFYRQLKRPRPPVVHLAFMAACADSANFVEAHEAFESLLARDKAKLAKNAEHKPLINDDLVTEYLRAALATSVRALETGAGVSPEAGSAPAPAPWETALTHLLQLRRDKAYPFRKHVELTPLLIESASQLAELGGHWQLCLQLLQGAAQQQMLVPPEAYDAAIRACYRHHKHATVVSLMEELIATKVAPDERSVRLALHSSEEEASAARRAGAAHSTAWALSLTLFHAMKQNGLVTYQQSYETPLRACVQAGKWEQAMSLLQTMRRDRRPVSPALYATVLSARVEHAASYKEIARLFRLSVVQDGQTSVVLYLAALRNCMARRDWRHFDQLNTEMKRKDIPEPYDKILLLIEAAYLRENYHGALMRFARFDNITNFEKQRVIESGSVRLYEEDFEVPERILDMVLDAYERVKDHKDPMVGVAFRAATARKAKMGASGHTRLHASSDPNHREAPPEWMFSNEAREARSPSPYH